MFIYFYSVQSIVVGLGYNPFNVSILWLVSVMFIVKMSFDILTQKPWFLSKVSIDAGTMAHHGHKVQNEIFSSRHNHLFFPRVILKDFRMTYRNYI